MNSSRALKISDLLRKEIASIISSKVRDPRLKKININAVKVSDDISKAKVFYTLIGESIKEKNLIDKKVLTKFAGMVRSELSKNMHIRRVPEIQFKFDESIEYSENIESLLKSINK